MSTGVFSVGSIFLTSSAQPSTEVLYSRPHSTTSQRIYNSSTLMICLPKLYSSSIGLVTVTPSWSPPLLDLEIWAPLLSMQCHSHQVIFSSWLTDLLFLPTILKYYHQSSDFSTLLILSLILSEPKFLDWYRSPSSSFSIHSYSLTLLYSQEIPVMFVSAYP